MQLKDVITVNVHEDVCVCVYYMFPLVECLPSGLSVNENGAVSTNNTHTTNTSLPKSAKPNTKHNMYMRRTLSLSLLPGEEIQ